MKSINFSKIGETLYVCEHTSGLKIYMVNKRGFTKSAAYFTTHFGSVDNTFIPLGLSEKITVPDGVAHFLEHKMFEMPDGENVFEMFGKYGASANAFTSFNITSYYFWCTNNFKENLKILINYVQTPHFTPENVAKEQGIIGQEIRMYDDDPNWQCYFNMISGLYQNHSISRDIAGTVESIAEITDETLNICYNTFYHPSNMTLCVVGDFEPDDMLAYINSVLEPVGDANEIQKFMADEPLSVASHKTEVKMSVSQPIYCIGFKEQPGIDVKKKLAVSLAYDLLLGKSSELYNTLYAQKLITPNFGYDFTMDKTYAFGEISDEGTDGEIVAKRVLEAAEAFRFSEEDLKISKRKLFGKSLELFNDPEKYGLALARSLTIGKNILEECELYDTITASEVEKVIKTHFTAENMTVSIVNPIK